MLDNTKFEVTIEHDELPNLANVLNLYKQLHASSYNFYFKNSASNVNTICIDTCHTASIGSEHYPLEALIPMIQYKASQLPQVQDPYIGGDGSSIKAFLIKLDHHGLKITRTYLYAGK